ncbi:MAG TPA: FUSC family protein [Solirubrobacteraceae bacterium]|nr:FUSC family protein [Solirubrobacteraceae bacterium]
MSSLFVVDRPALKSAARAAIVITGVFAFADKVIGNPSMALFAAFGAVALLVLVQFTGPPRTRLVAYLALGCVGAAFYTLGTLCSRSPWVATAAMAVVGFAALFSGVFSGYFSAGANAAILTFVLPATVPAANSAIPDRLAGWGLAAGAAICAAMLLWPPRRGDDLQSEAADAVRSVADMLDADSDQLVERGSVAHDAVQSLERRLLGTQRRPTGPTGASAALASLPGELDWLLSLLLPATGLEAPQPAGPEDEEAMAAAAAALRAAAERLEGREVRPDFARLDAARDAVAGALVQGLPDLVSNATPGSVAVALEAPFRTRAATYSARQVAGYALRAAGAEVPELDWPEPEPKPQLARAMLRATEQRAWEHASMASVWFQNSLRGAAGFALGVYIAQRTGVEHGFWVVLGTISVLRSNALGTSRSILSALVGTAVGIVLGAVLVIAIGTHEGVLWAVLPAALFLAAYAPRAISFAMGQAGFTVFVLVLFNLLAPVGWRVGLVRAEDVAVGFAISLGVGLLFWPRGAAALVRQDLAMAYERSADYLAAAARQLIDGGSSKDPAHAERAAADVAVRRLDEAFRQYLGERSATPVKPEDIAALVSGASRVRRAAQSLTALARMADGDGSLDGCGENLDRELRALQSWYGAFGFALMSGGALPPPHIHDDEEDARRLLSCVGDAAQGTGQAPVNAALALLVASQHLGKLSRLETLLSERANAVRTASEDGGALRRLRVLAS